MCRGRNGDRTASAQGADGGEVGDVTPEFWAIIGVGVGVAGLFYRLDTRLGRLDLRIDRLDDHVRGQGERLARLEGKVDTLIAVFVKPEST